MPRSAREKGPVIKLYGMDIRALQSEILMRNPGMQGEEILYWRGQVLEKDQALSAKQVELDKAETTIRNLEHEIRKLRRAVAELESR